MPMNFFNQRFCSIIIDLTGNDYLARFVCTDIARYEALTSALIEDPELGIARIVSHIALRPVRRFAGYPIALLLAQGDKAES